jgi:xylulokinase
MPDHFVVIDCGTSSCRAALVSWDGAIIRIARRPIQVDCPQPYVAEVDTETLWKQVCQALKELLEGGRKENIAAVGVSAMLGYVLLDRHGRPLMPAAIWMDNRARAQTARILEQIPEHILYAKTGRKPSPELLAPRLLWLAEHRPDVYQRTDRVIGLKDDIVRRLTGTIGTDPAHLDYTLLHNIAGRQLDDDILAALGIRAAIFPQARRADQLAGKLSAAAARMTGLAAGTPVAVGTSDGSTAMYGGGVLAKQTAVLVAGTTDVLMAATDRLVNDPQQILSVNTAMVPGHYLAGGAMGMAGGTIACFEKRLHTSVKRETARIAKLPPGCDGLMVFPGISGERAPYWLESTGGAVIGIGPNHRAEHMLRAVMEGCAYRAGALLDMMNGAGLKPDRVRVVGGAAANDTWNQIRADVWGMTVEKTDTAEATLRGAAMFCRSALEPHRGLADISGEWIAVPRRYEPDPASHAGYRKLAALFNEFIENNAKWHRALKESIA